MEDTRRKMLNELEIRQEEPLLGHLLLSEGSSLCFIRIPKKTVITSNQNVGNGSLIIYDKLCMYVCMYLRESRKQV